MTISILIIDDHAVVRQGLRLLLEARPEIEVIGEAADGHMALQLARTSAPDVILLDLLMPDMNGLQVLEKIKEHGLSSRVLILTSSIEDHLVQQALAGGADGYILKTTRSSELVAAINRVAQGKGALDPAAAQAVMRQTRGQDPLLTLTQREREVFDHLARGRNAPEIANLLTVSEATIRTHIASILEKLTLRDRVQVMAYAIKRGIVQTEDLM
jgi:DNA-binding NarL/FixJ family response regulator